MSSPAAFYGDASLKTQAVADAAACRHPGWHAAASESERVSCAELFGLSEGLVHLLVEAARPPLMDGSCEVLRTVLEAVPVGADLDNIIACWMVGLWDEPRQGLAMKLNATPAYAPAARIIDRIRVSKIQSATRGEWRQARAELLAALKTAPPDVVEYGRVVAAMAWDTSTTKGLAADVWTAWEHAAVAEVDLRHGWDQPAQDELLEALRHAMRQAHSTLGPPEASASPEAQAEREAAIQIEVDALMRDAGKTERWAALMAHWEDHLSAFAPAWRVHAYETLAAACRGAEQLASDRHPSVSA